MGEVVDRGDGLRNLSKYVVSAAHRLARKEEGYVPLLADDKNNYYDHDYHHDEHYNDDYEKRY